MVVMEKRLRLNDDDRLLLLESLYLYCHKYPEKWDARKMALAIMHGNSGRRAHPYAVQLYTIRDWITELREKRMK